MRRSGEKSQASKQRRRTIADRYLKRTRWRLGATYGLLLALLLIVILASTYATTRVHESGQIEAQLVDTANEKLHAPELVRVLKQSPRVKDEEEAVRTFVISRDGVVRDADAVVQHPPDQRAVRRVMERGVAEFSTIHGPSGAVAVYTVPIVRDGGVAGAIQTVTAKSPYSSVLQSLLVISLVVGVIGLVLAGVLGLVMATWGLRPIRAAITSQQVFAQNAAHELRAPLTLMRTAAELALRTGQPEDMRDALTTTVRETEHLDGVVGDLRLVAQGDIGRLRLDVEPLNLSELARQVYEEVRPTADSHRIDLRLDAAIPARVVADRTRLRQLLMILIDNAFRYTESGGAVDIRVSHRRGRAILIVEDTGQGIEARHLPHIFDRFYRGEEARSPHEGGTGLGLSIGREIVEAHGGQITVHSRPGAGTAFRVSLPLDTRT
jgi:signal transduction histidine kinase